MRNIMVVDDEANLRSLLMDLLMMKGYGVDTAASGEEALTMTRRAAPSLMLLDLRLPGISGLEVLAKLRAEGYAFPVIMVTAYGDVETAVNALKAGAVDFIVKPFEHESLLAAVAQALEAERVVETAGRSRPSFAGRAPEMIGDSAGIRDVFDLIDRVAETDATVLIRGESGTGKELVARAVHVKSKRAGRPLIGLNCAALPDTLLESELFGYERGAFTGAHAAKPGKIEMADKGTLFLDEVGDLSAGAQAKLLRFLEDQTFTRLGGTKVNKVDLRLIAATNRELETMMAAGSFRQDLFFRLNVVPVRLPPLRERKDDIPLLARHLTAKLCARHGKTAPGWADLDLWSSLPADVREEDTRLAMPKDILKQLVSYDWPGNIRELEHALEKWVLLGRLPLTSRGRRTVEDAAPAPPALPDEEARGPLAERLSRSERRIIVAALREAEGKKARAARALSISAKTLYNKMEKLGIGVEEYEEQ